MSKREKDRIEENVVDEWKAVEMGGEKKTGRRKKRSDDSKCNELGPWKNTKREWNRGVTKRCVSKWRNGNRTGAKMEGKIRHRRPEAEQAAYK